MSYTSGVFYLDYNNGSDTARTALTSCTASNPSGSTTRINKTGHGLVTGAVVDLTLFSTWLNAAWKITKVDNDNFDLDGAVWQATADTSGTVTPRGGSSWSDAWKTITSGATSARHQAGDVIRIAKSPAPYSIGNATWTNASKTVTLAGAQTANVDLCENAWTGLTGAISVLNATPTNGGSGYAVNDTFSITTGGTGATGKVTTVSGSTVTGVQLTAGGHGTYTTGTGKATSVLTGSGDGLLTVNITTVVNCNVTATATSTQGKEGTYSMKISPSNTTALGTRLAYRAITPGDLSAYQKISFWFYSNGTTAATTLRLVLCSDTAGKTVVDEFVLPAYTGASQWIPMTITKTGGGNLGASTASIALYTNTTGTTSTPDIYLDDIIACTTNGLNLQSLISKNSLEQGGTEGWYGIQSINGTTVLLDNGVNTLANAGRGYSTLGTSPETVATYARETIKTLLATSSSTAVQEIQASGSLGSLVEYQGGYNTSNSSQDGETFFDGLNGFGYGLYSTGKDYIKLNRINTTRYYYGMYLSGKGHQFDNILNISNNSQYGILGSLYYHTANNLANIINNSSDGASNIGGFSKNYIVLGNVSNNLGSGITMTASSRIIATRACNNNAYGIYFAAVSAGTIINCTTANNASGGVFVNTGRNNLMINCKINESTEVAGFTTSINGQINSQKHDQTAGNNWIFTEDGTINSQTTTRHTASGVAWKFSPGTTRTAVYPIELSVAKIALKSGTAVTIGAWVKKDHATQVQGQLLIRGGQIAGVDSDVTATMTTSDTNWNQLNLASITPTEDGVIEVICQAWYVSGASYVYIDDLVIA